MTNIPKDTTNLIAALLREIILTPKDFSVRNTEMNRSFTIHIQSNFPDHKKIIGSMRKHYLAVVSIVKRIAEKNGWTAEVAQIEFTGRAFDEPYPEFVARKGWPREKICGLILKLGRACFEYESEIQINAVDGSNGTTNIDLLVSRAEDAMIVSEMLTAFKTLIRPIGKSNGRTIYFNIVADVEHEPQPDNADGRHMKTVSR